MDSSKFEGLEDEVIRGIRGRGGKESIRQAPKGDVSSFLDGGLLWWSVEVV
jgi:hypothetical protein